jgi:ubiquinone biosynthesis protein UbiJ
MPATAPWLASAEVMFNRNMAGSAAARSMARRLEGASLSLEVEGFLPVRVELNAGRLALLHADDAPADAVISGSPRALLALLSSTAAARSGVRISGDAETANAFREFFGLVRPDLEEELARLVGDLPARHLARFARGATAWFAHAGRTARANIGEYLQEESRDLPSRFEVDEFLQAVDAVREAVDRVEARIKVLEAGRRGGG